MDEEERQEIFNDGFQQGYIKGYNEAESEFVRILKNQEKNYEYELQLKNLNMFEMFKYIYELTKGEINWPKLSCVTTEDYIMLKDKYKKLRANINEDN